YGLPSAPPYPCVVSNAAAWNSGQNPSHSIPPSIPERLSNAGRQYPTALTNKAGSRLPNARPRVRVMVHIQKQATTRQKSQNNNTSDRVTNEGRLSNSEMLIAGASRAGKP